MKFQSIKGRILISHLHKVLLGMGNNKMRIHSIIIILLGLILNSCSHSDKLTISYTGGGSLPIGTKIQAGTKEIGSIRSYSSNKEADTLFVTIELKPGVKIPVDSQFFIYENLLGPSRMVVNYSKEKTFLTSKDIVFAIFKPMQLNKRSSADTTIKPPDLKLLRAPRIDTTKQH
jgi:hypothetical protein